MRKFLGSGFLWHFFTLLFTAQCIEFLERFFSLGKPPEIFLLGFKESFLQDVIQVKIDFVWIWLLL